MPVNWIENLRGAFPASPALEQTLLRFRVKPDVVVVEIIDGEVVLSIGSNAWWDSMAPVAEFQAVQPVLAGSPERQPAVKNC